MDMKTYKKRSCEEKLKRKVTGETTCLTPPSPTSRLEHWRGVILCLSTQFVGLFSNGLICYKDTTMGFFIILLRATGGSVLSELEELSSHANSAFPLSFRRIVGLLNYKLPRP